MDKKRKAGGVAAVGALISVLMCLVVWSIFAISVAPTWVTAVLCVVATGVVSYLFPLEMYTRTPGVSRIFAVAAAACAAVAHIWTSTPGHFGIALFLLMFVAIAAGFLFEMLRKERAELIKSLSHIIFMATLGLVSSGWMMLPDALKVAEQVSPVSRVVLAVLVLCGFVFVCVCVSLWSCDVYDADQNGANATDSADLAELQHNQLWGYCGVTALLCGLFPLLISLGSAVSQAIVL